MIKCKRGQWVCLKSHRRLGRSSWSAGSSRLSMGWFCNGKILQWKSMRTILIRRIMADPIPDRQSRYPEAISNSSSGSSLELVSGNLPTRIIPIHDNFVIGRSSDNSLRLPDSSVSRHHVCLRFAQDMWFLQDQQSSGGTLVNGKNTEASRIHDGDEIAIGPFRFIFHAGG